MASPAYPWLKAIVESPAVGELLRRVQNPGPQGRVIAQGGWGSSTTLIAGALGVRRRRPVLLVVAHLDDADDALEDLDLFDALSDEATKRRSDGGEREQGTGEQGIGKRPDGPAGLVAPCVLQRQRFGALEVLPGESNVSLELLAERLAVVEQLVAAGRDHPVAPITGGQAASGTMAPDWPYVLIAPIQALMQPVPEPAALGEFSITLRPGQQMPPASLLDWLDRAGYTRADAVEQPGDFTTRGGIIDVYLPSGGGVEEKSEVRSQKSEVGREGQKVSARPESSALGSGPLAVRLDYFGDEIESISIIDTDTMGSGRRLDRVQVIGASMQRLQSDERTTSLLRLLPPDTLIVLQEIMELAEQARGYYERLTEARGIISPQTLLKTLIERPHVEINQYSTGSADPANIVQLPVRALPTFGQDAKQAIAELAEMAVVDGQRTKTLSQSSLLPQRSQRAQNRIDEITNQPVNEFTKPEDVSSASSATSAVNSEIESRGQESSDAGKSQSPLPAPRSQTLSRIIALCQRPAEQQRLAELLHEFAPAAEPLIQIDVGYLHRGFIWESGSGESRAKASAQEDYLPQSAQRTQSVQRVQSRIDELTNQRVNELTKPQTLSSVTSVSSVVNQATDSDEPAPLQLILVPNHELFHRYQTRRRIRRISAGALSGGGGGVGAGERTADAFLDLDPGDYVVHTDHGIARFVGLKSLRRKGVTEDFLTLEFAEKALLHVPAAQIDLVQKYIGGFQGKPPLSLLGGKRWAKQKEQVAEAVRDLAAEMLRIQAARAALPGVRYPGDTPWQIEFEAEFPYEETDDQLAAIAELKKDMADDQPMDRLICGDVGFGKTEVAIRGAFKAAEYGKQVAVLVPTTVLAEQHERTFRDRMADYPFRVESLSRFKTGGEQAKLLDDLAKGHIDIIIGTHRLLSADVRFADLGLVIIDEEQRFGVEHKQRLLQLRLTVDVLTLTATPIPRTLHMAMLGLRDISSLATAPLDRRAVVTEVMPYEKDRIRRAIVRELSRDGQVYFVHNRVHNIQVVADDLHRLVPNARIVIGHGQMAGHELEKVMLTFLRRKADILVCTTIIESGLDIATANTIFINEADNFGLADLHQLRGRVGRWKHRAYCYLLLPGDRPMTEKATRRLRAIEQYSMLGAGFKIAMRDLEIRGAGNLLGAEQSGHIAAVGYQMYCALLEQEAHKLRHDRVATAIRTHLEFPTPDGHLVGRIPPSYIAAEKYRMEAYRRISRAATLEELQAVARDLTDAYGKPPSQVATLLDLAELRIAASLLDIEAIKVEGPDVIFRTPKPQTLDPLLKSAAGRASLIDPTTIYYRPPPAYLEPATLLAMLRKLLVRTPVSGEPKANARKVAIRP